MLSRIFELHGDTAKAIEHNEKSINLGKDNDLGIVEVEDAWKIIAELRGGN